MIETKVQGNRHERDFKEPHLSIHDTEHLDQKARMASEMMMRWGMVAAEPDGEDSAGRAKLKLISEKALVTRACQMTALAFSEFERSGWITEFPTLKEMEEVVAKKEPEKA